MLIKDEINRNRATLAYNKDMVYHAGEKQYTLVYLWTYEEHLILPHLWQHRKPWNAVTAQAYADDLVEWEAIPQEEIQNLILSMTRCLAAIRKARGGNT